MGLPTLPIVLIALTAVIIAVGAGALINIAIKKDRRKVVAV
jgi:hypothetical protein